MTEKEPPDYTKKDEIIEAVRKRFLNQQISAKDDIIQSLQNDLEKEKDERREERFAFIVICILLLDVVFFSVIDNFAGPAALLILELIILIPLAAKLGREDLKGLLSGVLDTFARRTKGGGDD